MIARSRWIPFAVVLVIAAILLGGSALQRKKAMSVRSFAARLTERREPDRDECFGYISEAMGQSAARREPTTSFGSIRPGVSLSQSPKTFRQ